MKKNYLIQAWLVLLLAVVFGVALAFVENVTRPRIEQNVKDLIARRLVDMFGEGTRTDKPVPVEGEIAGRSKKIHCYPAIRQGRRVGWGILATGQGYDTLTLLIGVDERVETLKGYRVIKSLETAGIGDKIKKEKSDFYKQFESRDATKPLSPISPGKQASGQEYNTISGATISSKGVGKTINDNLAAVRGKLADIAKEGAGHD
ncbi:MAG: FMN-binding protein [Planctomycetota bacterium]|nr:FMN-binding protein [Planctomycetota bacterium]